MPAAADALIRYLTVTSAIGLAVGVVHGGACAYRQQTTATVPTVMTHAVGGAIAAQYFPLTVPYYLYKGGDCPHIQKWRRWSPATEKKLT